MTQEAIRHHRARITKRGKSEFVMVSSLKALSDHCKRLGFTNWSIIQTTEIYPIVG